MKSAPDSQNGQSILGVYIIPRRRPIDFNRYLSGFKPDVYFKPQEVWEIRGAESVTFFYVIFFLKNYPKYQ